MPATREALLVQDVTEKVREAGGPGQQDAETCPKSRLRIGGPDNLTRACRPEKTGNLTNGRTAVSERSRFKH
ncbi:hypothetical protein E4U09_003560 [Claviceps aff. purpurea]|uniref:Uncharacterized protein n=1 Tax=Claviceps aff. purpurea TaxID=1967640 RepID=A0A9P7QE89_9HYPO|nr:hypothetical protein E4U09_003560 [Claviceps aff. purpurea]